MDIFEVAISEKAKKMLKKMPAHIVFKLSMWIDQVKNDGLIATRNV